MMTIEGLAPYLAGPGAAVLVLLLVGAGVYRLAVQYLVPLLQGAVDRHLGELERANARHERAVGAHMAHIAEMGVRYDRLAAQHATEHAQIMKAVEDVGHKVQHLQGVA